MIDIFDSIFTIKQIYEDGFEIIPYSAGIYVVFKPENMNINFLPLSTAINKYKEENMLYDVNILNSKYEKSDKLILYIGKAGGKNKLRKRIKQLVRYGYNEVNNHRGGRAIWQIEDNKNLLIGYKMCNYPELTEKNLLLDYCAKNNVLPVGNWKIG